VEDAKRRLMKLVDEVNALWPGALFFAAEGDRRSRFEYPLMERRYLTPTIVEKP
jgi:hypothetical protein